MDSNLKRPIVPIRLILAMLGIYSSALVYTQRTAMSVAIVAMLKNKHEDDPNHGHVCSLEINQNKSIVYQNISAFNSFTDSKASTYDWSETTQGIILGAHFWLYAITPTVAGRLCGRFGGKWITLVGNSVSFLLNLIVPVVIENFGAPGLIIVRALMGAFHGCVFSPLFVLYLAWFPPSELASANATMSFGGALGATIMATIAGWLSGTHVGWPLVFYVNALMYIPFLILWYYYVTDQPSQNRHISDYELDFLKQQMPSVNATPKKRKQAPWSAIATSRPVMCSAVAKMCAGYGYFLLLSKVPSYLSTVFGLSLLNNGGINAVMTLGQGIVSLLTGPFSSWIIVRTGIRKIIIRKIFQGLAMCGPALCLAMIPIAGCNSGVVIVCLILALCTYGTLTGGEWTTISEYAPNSTGVVFGVTNCFAVLAGIVGPYIVGVILGDDPADHLERWNLVFYTTAAVFVTGAINFALFGTDQPQAWDLALNDEPEDAKESIPNNPYGEQPKILVISSPLQKNQSS